MGKIAQLLAHPTELRAAVQLKLFKKTDHPVNLDESPTLRQCHEFLELTSRSFAAVIRELHPELRNAVMLFYLVLRALDTVEDDMTLEPLVKVPLLREFHTKLALKDWTFSGSGPNEKDRAVLVGFDAILAEYHRLKAPYQDIIQRITKKMGNGMADYVLDEQFNTNGVASVADYNLYCHYVAGLVGEGLLDLMVLAQFASSSVQADNYRLSELMGLFLQKTNIIRDYREDLEDGRSFYPREVWSKHAELLPALTDPKKGVPCINELVLDALGHVTDVLTYLLLITEPTSFSFCAIPQVMAIATLAEVYSNAAVLERNVKIRKGTTCKLVLELRSLPGVVAIFRRYIRAINAKLQVEDPSYLQIGLRLGQIEQFCEAMYPRALPAGALQTPAPIAENVRARGNFDAVVEAKAARETFRCNALLVLAALLVAWLLWTVGRFWTDI